MSSKKVLDDSYLSQLLFVSESESDSSDTEDVTLVDRHLRDIESEDDNSENEVITYYSGVDVNYGAINYNDTNNKQNLFKNNMPSFESGPSTSHQTHDAGIGLAHNLTTNDSDNEGNNLHELHDVEDSPRPKRMRVGRPKNRPLVESVVGLDVDRNRPTTTGIGQIQQIMLRLYNI